MFESQAHRIAAARSQQKDQSAQGAGTNDIQFFVQHVPLKGAVLSAAQLRELDTQPVGASSDKLQSTWITATECSADDAEADQAGSCILSVWNLAFRVLSKNGANKSMQCMHCFGRRGVCQP
jgi:hypothetical protein